LKRGLGGFSELLFEAGKLFNHESYAIICMHYRNVFMIEQKRGEYSLREED
jgi:hypothetical protein